MVPADLQSSRVPTVLADLQSYRVPTVLDDLPLVRARDAMAPSDPPSTSVRPATKVFQRLPWRHRHETQIVGDLCVLKKMPYSNRQWLAYFFEILDIFLLIFLY